MKRDGIADLYSNSQLTLSIVKVFFRKWVANLNDRKRDPKSQDKVGGNLTHLTHLILKHTKSVK